MNKFKITLRELRETELELLKHFAAFCRRENITFFLSNGTLLGAVKYGGFIPWDDDIDVLVPRRDYERLISIYPDSARYRLFSCSRCACYRFPFAKLCDMTTEKREENVDNGLPLGVDIDIFPLDSWATDACRQARKMERQRKWLTFFKCRRAISVNPLKRLVKSTVLRLGRPLCAPMARRMDRLAGKQGTGHGPSYLGCVVWCIYGRREILPAEVFSSAVSVCFEGEQFPAPVGYEQYLHSLYGDYLSDPPETERVSHHHFRAYRKEIP